MRRKEVDYYKYIDVTITNDGRNNSGTNSFTRESGYKTTKFHSLKHTNIRQLGGGVGDHKRN